MRRTIDRRRPSVWTVIAFLLFVAALTAWIVIRPNDADQENQRNSLNSSIATSSVPAGGGAVRI